MTGVSLSVICKVSYKELNADLARHLDAVADACLPLVVRRKKKAVVVMPLDEFGRLMTKAGDLGSLDI